MKGPWHERIRFHVQAEFSDMQAKLSGVVDGSRVTLARKRLVAELNAFHELGIRAKNEKKFEGPSVDSFAPYFVWRLLTGGIPAAVAAIGGSRTLEWLKIIEGYFVKSFEDFRNSQDNQGIQDGICRI